MSKIIDVYCDWDTQIANISIHRIDKNTGAFQRNRYKCERHSTRSQRILSIINKATRVEWINNQYNNHAEIMRYYINV